MDLVGGNLMKIFDAHMHLRSADEKGVDEIINLLSAHKEWEILLILNSYQEYKVVRDHYEKFLAVKNQIRFAVILLPENFFIKEALKFLGREQGYKTVVKIHPRLSNMKYSQMDSYIECLRELDFNTVVVDNFVYGSTVADFTTDFINRLALEFKDKNIVMAHSGGCDLLHNLMVTKDKKNIWYEISMTCTYLYESSVRFDMIQLIKFHSKRVIFGSDFPDWKTEQALNVVEELMAVSELNQMQKEDILYNNAICVYT